MRLITSITNQPKQNFNVVLDDNSVVTFNLYYMMTQQAWYFDFKYGDYECNGNKVVLTFNALKHLRKKLPFGIAFISSSQSDPFDLNDFQNQDVMMLLLNSDEVQEYESLIYE